MTPLEKRRAYARKYAQRIRNSVIEVLGGECVRCGYKKTYKALQFHHKDRTKKDFAISGLDCSFKKSVEEAKKCILVCANCHAEIEEELLGC